MAPAYATWLLLREVVEVTGGIGEQHDGPLRDAVVGCACRVLLDDIHLFFDEHAMRPSTSKLAAQNCFGLALRICGALGRLDAASEASTPREHLCFHIDGTAELRSELFSLRRGSGKTAFGNADTVLREDPLGFVFVEAHVSSILSAVPCPALRAPATARARFWSPRGRCQGPAASQSFDHSVSLRETTPVCDRETVSGRAPG